MRKFEDRCFTIKTFDNVILALSELVVSSRCDCQTRIELAGVVAELRDIKSDYVCRCIMGADFAIAEDAVFGNHEKKVTRPSR